MTEGLLARIDKAKKLLDKLMVVPLMERDTSRVKDVLASIEHNTKILKGEV